MPGTRDRILDAAAHVMRTHGFARTTTKQIARAAGYSEASLYKNFQDKTDLFLAVLKERLPSLTPVLRELSAAPGEGALAERLAAVVQGAIAFYEASFPISASIFSDPVLLAAHHDAVTAQGSGPRHPLLELARYLRLEQQHGGDRPGADCDAAASMLLGSAFQYAFFHSFAQLAPDPEAAAAHAASAAATLLAGLEP